MLTSYNQYCSKLQSENHYRQLFLLPQDKAHIDFSSNDYLGLSQQKALVQAATKAGECWGAGATGSRLLSGNSQLLNAFEKRIAQDKGTEAALVFSSGFQANLTVLASLLDKRVLAAQPLVFFDQLNHSSLYNAVFLSGAELIRYQHNDMSHLASLLKAAHTKDRPKFIVTETVYGMDGDKAHLNEIIALAEEHKAFVYLDEAHATGLFGPQGYGLSTDMQFNGIPHLVMGTFSKALGVSGAYIACSQDLRNYIINKTTGFVYSTAPSPLVVGAAQKAWEWVPHFQPERKKLFAMAQHLRNELSIAGFDTGLSNTHIVPVILKDEKRTLDAKVKLARQGIIVSAIRPPTVMPAQSRLRLALNTTHTELDIEKTIAVIKTL